MVIKLTNFEKYKSEILSLNGSFMFDKYTEEIAECYNCSQCIFYHSGKTCRSLQIKWLYEEVNSPMKLQEKIICEGLNIYNQDRYLARDRNGVLHVHCSMPTKCSEEWVDTTCFEINPKLFQFVTWDSGVWSIKELLEAEKLDEELGEIRERN